MDTLNLLTHQIVVAEQANENGNIPAKFVLCDFDINRNTVRLERDTIENWCATIINKPLVGKIIGGDFEGHRMRLVTRRDGEGNIIREITFDTDAFGVFTDVSIEKGYDEKNPEKEFLVASCELWTRYPKAIKLIRDRARKGTLATSWEIQILDSYVGPDGEKVVTDGVFCAHTLLGAKTIPAYDSSRLLEVAELTEPDIEFFEALTEDVASQGKENPTMEEFTVVVSEEDGLSTEAPETTSDDEAVEEKAVVDTEDSEQNEESPTEVSEDTSGSETIEISALTDRDIRKHLDNKMRELHKDDSHWYDLVFVYPAEFYALFHRCGDSDMSFIGVTYTVTEDSVEISEEQEVTLTARIRDFNAQMAEKDEALLKANEMIQALEAEIENLKPYKAAAEKAEAARLEAEKQARVDSLRAYALKSKMIEESELEDKRSKVAKMVANADEDGIKKLIAERFMTKLDSEKATEVETSETSTPAGCTAILNEDEVVQKVNPISVYLMM